MWPPIPRMSVDQALCLVHVQDALVANHSILRAVIKAVPDRVLPVKTLTEAIQLLDKRMKGKLSRS